MCWGMTRASGEARELGVVEAGVRGKVWQAENMGESGDI